MGLLWEFSGEHTHIHTHKHPPSEWVLITSSQISGYHAGYSCSHALLIGLRLAAHQMGVGGCGWGLGWMEVGMGEEGGCLGASRLNRNQQSLLAAVAQMGGGGNSLPLHSDWGPGLGQLGGEEVVEQPEPGDALFIHPPPRIGYYPEPL